MKKYKYLLFFFIIFIVFMCFENVYAEDKCNVYNNLCKTQTYKFDKNGVPKDFEIILGFVHFKDIDSSNENEQFVVSYDECGKCAEGNTCKHYCSKTPFRFNINSSGDNAISISVDTTSVKYPFAICAFPFNGSVYLNSNINDSNISDYIYYSAKDVTNAISNNKCKEKDVYYSGAQDSTVCNQKITVGNFISTGDLTGASISVSSTNAGVSLCNVSMKKNNTSKSYTHASSPYLCFKENYQVSCYSQGSDRYSCTLYACNNKGLSSDSSNISGIKCTMRNTLDNNDTVQLQFTFVKGNDNAKLNAILKDGKPVKDTLIVDLENEIYADGRTCPTYVYYFLDNSTSTKYSYRILNSETEKQTFEQKNPDARVITRYKFTSSLDMKDLYSYEVYDVVEKEEDEYNSPIWGDKVDLNCNGIIGEEALDFINEIFSWIQIVAPIFVIIISAVEFGGAVLQDDKDALKKASSKLIKRLIIAVALFFIPMILSFILDVFNEASGAFSSTCGIGE